MFNRAFLVLSVFLSVFANSYYSVTHKLSRLYNCFRAASQLREAETPVPYYGHCRHREIKPLQHSEVFKGTRFAAIPKIHVTLLAFISPYFVISNLACVFLPEFSRCFKMFRKSLEILRAFWEIFWDFLRFSENVFYRRNI